MHYPGGRSGGGDEPRVTAPRRRLAGLAPGLIVGGVSILGLLIDDPAYRANPLRQDLWLAGDAHAGVLLVLALVALRYVDEAALGARARSFTRHAIPAAAILLPAAFFLSVTDPAAAEPNAMISLAYAGASLLAAGLVTLGVGLIRPSPGSAQDAG